MKKTLSLIAVASALIFSSQANAKDGVYVGADLLTSNAEWKYGGDIGSIGSTPQKKVDGTSVGAGLSVGYKKSFNSVFVAPEIFYDYLNSSTHDYYYNTPVYKQDSLELRSRYGAKANIGYNFSEKFSAYATYGLALIDHVDNFPTATTVQRSQGKWKTAAIYGIGAVFNINENLGIKAEINSQRFNVPYSYDAETMSKVRLNVLKTGLVYSF